MEIDAFEEPVTIFRGLGFPSPAETVAEVYALLVEWPQHQRGPTYDAAFEASRAALDGKIEAGTARRAFVAFARSRKILLPESTTLAAALPAEASTQRLQG